MAKVQIVTKFDFNWVHGHMQCFESRGWQVELVKKPNYDESVDLYILMWLDRENFEFIMKYDIVNITYIRRYEFYNAIVDELDWSRVNQAVVLNDYYAKGLKHRTGKDAEIIYNGVLPENWSFKKRGHGKKIACVGMITYKKCFPLAYQILSKMPRDYTLHIAGQIQSAEFMCYLDNIMANKPTHEVFIDGPIEDVDAWLENKNYILSTSIAEGCPNNVIEAMAKGIKPVIHCWPGAPRMFGEHVFYTIDEAVRMMEPDSPYDSEQYNKTVLSKFGTGCYEQLFELAERTISA